MGRTLKLWEKAVAVFSSIALVVTLCPAVALAASGGGTPSGTLNDPYVYETTSSALSSANAFCNFLDSKITVENEKDKYRFRAPGKTEEGGWTSFELRLLSDTSVDLADGQTYEVQRYWETLSSWKKTSGYSHSIYVKVSVINPIKLKDSIVVNYNRFTTANDWTRSIKEAVTEVNGENPAGYVNDLSVKYNAGDFTENWQELSYANPLYHSFGAGGHTNETIRVYWGEYYAEATVTLCDLRPEASAAAFNNVICANDWNGTLESLKAAMVSRISVTAGDSPVTNPQVSVTLDALPQLQAGASEGVTVPVSITETAGYKDSEPQSLTFQVTSNVTPPVVSVVAADNGVVAVSNIAEGSSGAVDVGAVSVSAEPEQGFYLKSLTVKTGEGELTDISEGKFFTAAAGSTYEVKAVFEQAIVLADDRSINYNELTEASDWEASIKSLITKLLGSNPSNETLANVKVEYMAYELPAVGKQWKALDKSGSIDLSVFGTVGYSFGDASAETVRLTYGDYVWEGEISLEDKRVATSITLSDSATLSKTTSGESFSEAEVLDALGFKLTVGDTEYTVGGNGLNGAKAIGLSVKIVKMGPDAGLDAAEESGTDPDAVEGSNADLTVVNEPGTYAVTVSFAANKSNYKGSEKSATLTVTDGRAETSITMHDAEVSYATHKTWTDATWYDEVVKAMGINLTGAPAGAKVALSQATYPGAGTYTITASYAGTNSHKAAADVSATLTLVAAPTASAVKLAEGGCSGAVVKVNDTELGSTAQSVSVDSGENVNIVISPAEGYYLAGASVDGEAATGNNDGTFTYSFKAPYEGKTYTVTVNAVEKTTPTFNLKNGSIDVTSLNFSIGADDIKKAVFTSVAVCGDTITDADKVSVASIDGDSTKTAITALGEHKVLIAYAGDGKTKAGSAEAVLTVVDERPATQVLGKSGARIGYVGQTITSEQIAEEIVASVTSNGSAIELGDGQLVLDGNIEKWSNGIIGSLGEGYHSTLSQTIGGNTLADLLNVEGKYRAKVKFLGNDNYAASSSDWIEFEVYDGRAETELKADNYTANATDLDEISYPASYVKDLVFESVIEKNTDPEVVVQGAEADVVLIMKGRVPVYSAGYNGIGEVDGSITEVGEYSVTLRFAATTTHKESTKTVTFTVKDARPETQVNLLGGKVLAYTAASPITEDRILAEVFAGVSCKGNPDEVIPSAHDAVKLTIYSGSDGETPIAANKITEAGTYKAVVKFAGNNQYKGSEAEVEFTVSDGRDVTAVVSNGQDFVKLNPMTGDTLTSDAIVEALGIAVNNTTKNTVVPVSEYSVIFSEAPDKMKVGGSYTATVSFEGDAAQAPCSKVISFKVVDSRAAVQLDVNATVEVPYGTSNEALLEALLDGKRGIVDSATDAVVAGNLALDIKDGNAAELNVGTYNATVSFAGDNAHQAAEVEVEVAIVKADASVVVDSKTVGYTSAGYNTKDFVSVSPEADHISFAVGLSLGENASSDAGVEAYVNIPSLIDLDSSSIPDSMKSLIKDALKELSDGSTMTVTQLKDALTELSKAIEAANKIGDYFGFTISTESIDTLISILTQIEKIDGIGSLTIRVTMGDDGIAVKNSGVYLAGAVTADPNYNTEAGLGYLFVTPDATRVELAFNFEDENGVVAIQNVIDGTYDFGAHVVKTDGLSDEDLQAASEHLNSLFIGIDENGESVISDSPVASRGAYTQIAYIRDLGNEMYYAKPIARAYVVTTDVAVVEFVDEGGNVVTSGSFTYDGKAHGMKARVSTRGGAAIEAAEVSYKYLGLERGVAFYNSSELPTAAGAYTVVASYVSEDKTMAGVGVAALTIAPAESSVEVSDLYHVYDGNRVKVASMVSSTPDEAEVALVTAGLDVSGDFSENGMSAVSGVVNIDFPAYVDELLKPVCQSAYADGISLDTFVGKLTELKDKLVDLGVSEESVDELIAMLQSMPNAVTLTFKDQEAVDPTSIGAYLVFACTMDPNYQFSSDLGVLVIGPEVTVADLNWNYVDPNGVITSPIVGSVDFGASAFVDGVANDEYTAKIQYLFVGIDDSGNIVTKTDASGLGNGAYTQVAYILDEASADMVCAKPITRAFVVSPQVYGVTFIDGKANPNADQLFVYDGNPHAMEVLVTNPNGDPIGSTLEGDGPFENLTVTYIGIQGDGKGYCSTEPPTAAGVYSVVAVYAVRDAEGTLLYAGAAVGAMAIQLGEAAFEVVDTSVKYDGTEKFPTISNPDGLPYILSVVIDSENNVNVILPEAWKVDPFAIDDLDDGVAALVAKIEAAASGLQNEDCRAAFEKLAEVLEKVEMKSLSINGTKPVDVGVYQVHAIGFGNSNLVPAYDSGTLEITEADPEKIDISGAVIGGFDSTYERTGSAITPDVTVTLDGKVLVKDVDYTVDYSGNVEVGKATITVTGIGSYTGTTSANFWIVSLFDIYGTNVGLYNNIGMNFFVKKTDIVETKSYYAVITKTYADGRDDAVYRIPFEDWESQSKDLCRFGFTGIAAKEMCDVVKVQVFTDDGLPASHEYTDSLRSYAMRLLGKSGNKLLRTTLVDMLNYGASAQIKFNYGTNDLANAQLTSDQKAQASSAVSCSDSLVQGDRYYGTSVSAESNLVLTFYFTDLDTATHAVVTYTDHCGNNKTFDVDAKDFVVHGDLRGIDVGQLVIADCSQLVTCKVYAGDTLIASASDSVEGYVARAMARQDGSDVYENMLKFAVSARTYFDSLK